MAQYLIEMSHSGGVPLTIFSGNPDFCVQATIHFDNGQENQLIEDLDNYSEERFSVDRFTTVKSKDVAKAKSLNRTILRNPYMILFHNETCDFPPGWVLSHK